MNDGTAKTQTHYQQASVQPVEVLQMHMTPEEFQGYLKGNIVKYLFRAEYKGQRAQDIAKALQYAAWLVQAVRGQVIDPREENNV